MIGSVHAFSKSAIGPLFFVFIATTFAGSAYLLWRGWDTLKSENETDSMFSVNSRRKPPWHGLGVVLDEYPKSMDEALEKVGLGWKVSHFVQEERTSVC